MRLLNSMSQLELELQVCLEKWKGLGIILPL